MGFTPDYIQLCYRYKDMYRNKRAHYGDWHGNLSTGQLQVCTSPGTLTFGMNDCFYIPDLDDLFEFLNNQVCAIHRAKIPEMKINLSFDNENCWNLTIELETGELTVVSKSESPHEALLRGIIQLTVFVEKKK